MPTKVELEVIAEILPSLNYYQILKTSTLASTDEIQDAFHREAFLYHPDRYFGQSDAALSNLAKKIYGVVVEAYRVLSQGPKREAYDRDLELAKNENEVTARRDKKPSTASSPAQRFYKLAQNAYTAGDLNSARMNISIALNSNSADPDILYLSQKIETDIKRKAAK